MEAAGIAPDWRAISWPSLKSTKVGIARIPKRADGPGASSVLSLVTSQRPPASAATLANSGATILHGPHHAAQKSTTTGRADRAVRASKAASSGITIGSAGSDSLVPHLAQRGDSGSRS